MPIVKTLFLFAAVSLLPACDNVDAPPVDTTARPELMVDTAWLAAHLDDPGIRIVDPRPRGYEEGHIPGAVWFDPATARDSTNPPTFLPPPDVFARAMGDLGISNDTHIIFYDDAGGVRATRTWVVLNHYGHSKVSFVDGGWLKWTAEGRRVTTDLPTVEPATFTPSVSDSWIVTAEDILAVIDDPHTTIVDTRTQGEFDGLDRRGITRGGHIPSAILSDWADSTEGEFTTFRPAAELRELFLSRGIGPTDSIVLYCNVGARAAHELFVLHLLGYDTLRLYLGSWRDWGERDELPLAK